MTKKFAQIWFYILFIILAILAFVSLYLLRYHPLTQFTVIVILAIFYFVTGILYHLARRDLTKQIVAEFAALAVLAILSFGLVTFWRII